MSLIPALMMQRQVNLCEIEASLVYRVSSRTSSKASLNEVVSLGPVWGIGNPVSNTKTATKSRARHPITEERPLGS